MVKYRCFKTECPECGNTGSLQLFINNSGRVTYARVRHYQGKGKYTYCKIEKTQLETLKCQSIQYPPVLDQGQSLKPQHHKLGQANLSLNSENKWAGSSARIEHHPPKVRVVGSNPTPPVGDKPRTVLEIFALAICVF
jgi:hypothetical protein